MFLCKVHYKIQFLLLRSLEFYGNFYDYLIVIHVAMENHPYSTMDETLGKGNLHFYLGISEL